VRSGRTEILAAAHLVTTVTHDHVDRVHSYELLAAERFRPEDSQ
jgi:hypothetical protein